MAEPSPSAAACRMMQIMTSASKPTTSNQSLKNVALRNSVATRLSGAQPLDASEIEAARKRAIRARCQALRPAKMGSRDIRYVVENYISMEDATAQAGRRLTEVEALVDRGLLPRPSYTLPDGTRMVTSDFLALWIDAKRATDIPGLFFARYKTAATTHAVPFTEDEIEQAWLDYLAGLYGVCLKQVIPENILEKGVCCDRIEGLLEWARPDDEEWLSRLRAAVDRLDELERPFTGYDRRRFGGPTSRDRLITAVRRRFPQIQPA
ncbi:DUF6058 family natural product biosynthesis protein [Kribbella swartbergensis]